MSEDKSKPRRRSGWHWLLWWMIDQDELAQQVAEYRSLGFFRSARKVCLALLIFSAVVTSLLTYFGGASLDASAYVEAVAFLILGTFIYFGHRWAMVVAMVVWTLEKGFFLFQGLTNGHSPIVQVIWWCIYMHAFFLAFRVEQERRRLTDGAAISANPAL